MSNSKASSPSLIKFCLWSLNNPKIDNNQINSLYNQYPLLFRNIEVLSIKNHFMYAFLNKKFRFRNYIKNERRGYRDNIRKLIECLRKKQYYQLKVQIDRYLDGTYGYVHPFEYSSYIMAQIVSIIIAFAVSFGYKYMIEKLLNPKLRCCENFMRAFYSYPKYDFHYVYENIREVYYLDIELYKSLVCEEFNYTDVAHFRKIYNYNSGSGGCRVKVRDENNINKLMETDLLN